MTADGIATLRDAEGFTDWNALQEVARRYGLEEFEKRHPVPALVTIAVTRDAAMPAPHELTPTPGEKREQSFRRTLAATAEKAPPERVRRYDGRVAFLAKRPGNPFPGLISVGRAMNNDIVVLLDTVSKFQGYFTNRDGWCFTDQRSSNGTRRNGSTLPPAKSIALEDGDRLELGVNIVLRYTSPASLYRQLRGES